MCTEDEAAAYPVSENQICAVGAGTSAFRVTVLSRDIVFYLKHFTRIKLIYIFPQGDSGGPISLKSGDQHVQVGDVSFGPSCIVSGYQVR